MAHLYETRGMRRVHLKGRNNILNWLLVHAGGFNLAAESAADSLEDFTARRGALCV